MTLATPLSDQDRAEIQTLISQSQGAQAFEKIKQLSTPHDDSYKLRQLLNLMGQLDPAESPGQPLRVALAGSSTLHLLADALRFHLRLCGFSAEISVCDFGTDRQSLLNPNSELFRGRPQIVWIFSTRFDVTDAGGAAQDQVSFITDLWTSVKKHSSAHILQNNIDLPLTRSLGHFESHAGESASQFYRQVNDLLARRLIPGVSIFDYDWLSSSYGKWDWNDDRFWHDSKYAFPLNATSLLAFNGARLIEAALGRAKKCLALDLDDTLWGGVIGDDGLDGIQIGAGDAIGESFLSFQKYILELKKRGVLLAVCSKNEEAVAKAVFEKRPEMALRLNDFAIFVANWKNKAENIQSIARTLNLRLDSLVFADNSAAERELVRQLLPDVSVLELSDDPADYVRALDDQRYFEVIELTAEDGQRTKMYQENALRSQHRESITNVDDYLRSLNMSATATSVHAANAGRISQLINRSNQFNLTGAKRSVAEIEALIGDKNSICRAYTLTDRFGDNGLVSTVLLKCDSATRTLTIDAWVMSCRVLERGLERFVQNDLLRAARRVGAVAIKGQFIPNSKNKLAERLLPNVGYSPGKNSTAWEMQISATQPSELPMFIAAGEGNDI